MRLAEFTCSFVWPARRACNIVVYSRALVGLWRLLGLAHGQTGTKYRRGSGTKQGKSAHPPSVSFAVVTVLREHVATLARCTQSPTRDIMPENSPPHKEPRNSLAQALCRQKVGRIGVVCVRGERTTRRICGNTFTDQAKSNLNGPKARRKFTRNFLVYNTSAALSRILWMHTHTHTQERTTAGLGPQVVPAPHLLQRACIMAC